MHLKFVQVQIAIEKLVAFDCLHFNDFFSVLSHNLVSNGWNFMKLILSIYDHGVVMHPKFCQDILNYCHLIA